MHRPWACAHTFCLHARTRRCSTPCSTWARVTCEYVHGMRSGWPTAVAQHAAGCLLWAGLCDPVSAASTCWPEQPVLQRLLKCSLPASLQVPAAATQGRELPLNQMSELLRQECAMAGFTEVLTWCVRGWWLAVCWILCRACTF